MFSNNQPSARADRIRNAGRICARGLLLGLACASARAADVNWEDVESRIQYGYYTEDARSLHNVMELLAPAEAADSLRSYYAGLANYRLALLAAKSDKGQAKDAANACVSRLDQALRERKDFADALALQSACLDEVATLSAWKSPFAASRSGEQIEKARHLAPRNPRVLLLDAVSLYERPSSTAADKARAQSGFKRAAEAFEAERQETAHTPGWGAAEAYVYVARCALEKGAPLEARDALERALLIAPEFAQARRLMVRITTG